MTRRTAAVLVAGLVLALTAGCVRLPEDGPVVAVEPGAARSVPQGLNFDPPPPAAGADAEEVVSGFLLAMTAAPIRPSVAKEFLTADAAESWRPAGTIVFDDVTRIEHPDRVDVHLSGAFRIDERGRWRGSLPPEESTLRLPVVLEDGEWRIDAAPDALVVPDTYFAERFVRATVHWFDPAGEVLVPEPVFVPSGGTMTSALVRTLLLGPPADLRGVVRSYLPAGLRAAPVTISSGGSADIRLSGELPATTPDQVERMVAQVAWTLRQVVDLDTFRITVGDQRVTLPGGAADFWTGEGAEFDPVGGVASSDLFGLVRGRLTVLGPGGFEPVDGVVGTRATGWRSFAVEPGGGRVAGIDGSGGTAVLAPVRSRDEAPVQVAQGGVDLLKPAWDAAGGLWLVDARDGDALVMLAGGASPRRLDVPGVSGERVRRFLVSRDGSRLVAVVSGRRQDRLVVSRVVRDDRGRVLELTRARTVDTGLRGPVRLRDVAWDDPTSVLVLFDTAGEVSQVRSVSLDGSAVADLTPVTTLRGRVRSLVGSPDPADPAYAVGRDLLLGLDDAVPPPVPADLDPATLTWMG